MEREAIDRHEGRTLFGADPAGYDRARPGHAERVYEVLVERCGLGPHTPVLEVGPGTGQATRRLLDLGADPLVAVEPDPALAEYLATATRGRVEIRIAALEEVELPSASFELAVAASSFHWVDENAGLRRLIRALRPGGWVGLWWTVFGEAGRRDSFMRAVDHLLSGLARSPSERGGGRRAHALDVEARRAALRHAGFVDFGHETALWRVTWDRAGVRDLYASLSPIRRLDDVRRKSLLDEVERIADEDFGGRVERTITTSIFTARRPP